MAIMETRSRATHRSLMNRSKDDLATLCLQVMDQNGRLDKEIRRLRDALVSARWRLAKGRPLWNGPCHECDAALEKGLTGVNIRDQASERERAALEAADARFEPLRRAFADKA